MWCFVYGRCRVYLEKKYNVTSLLFSWVSMIGKKKGGDVDSDIIFNVISNLIFFGINIS